MQRHPPPAKRQHRFGGIDGKPYGVQYRIQDGWMDPHLVDLHTGLAGRGDLSEDLRPAPPDRDQSLKSRAVLIASRRQPLIAVGHIHAHRTGRRPHRQIRRGLRGGDRQCALGVQ